MSSATKWYHRLSSCRPWVMTSPTPPTTLSLRGLPRSTDGPGVRSVRGYAGVRTSKQSMTAEDQKVKPVSSSLDGRLQALAKSHGQAGRRGRVDIISESLCAQHFADIRAATSSTYLPDRESGRPSCTSRSSLEATFWWKIAPSCTCHFYNLSWTSHARGTVTSPCLGPK